MAPLLMLPHRDEKTQEVRTLSLLSLQQQQDPSFFVGELIFHSTVNLHDCIGSSKGCLAFLDPNTSDPFLINPISQTLLPLPSAQTLPPTTTRGHPHQLRHPKIEKLVLLCGGKTAILMYTATCQLWQRTSVAFCRHGDRAWTRLPTRVGICHDVVCHDPTQTAFVLGPGPTVEAWDMRGPVPCMRATIPCPPDRALALFRPPPGPCCTTRWYLAVSESGQVFVAVRYIGEEEDEPYKTVGFDVFKHDGEEWVGVESLGDDCAMFLGGNESMMVSTSGEEDFVKGNAIYFTDDYWDRVDEDCGYGGHDMGIFNLEDRSIEGNDQVPKIVPPPFWIRV